MAVVIFTKYEAKPCSAKLSKSYPSVRGNFLLGTSMGMEKYTNFEKFKDNFTAFSFDTFAQDCAETLKIGK